MGTVGKNCSQNHFFALLATAARKKRRKAKHFSENLMSIFQAEST